jgi:acetyl-CoA C-acetyltransferase
MDYDKRRVAIVSQARIPFARAHGAYRGASNQDLATAALSGLVERAGIAGERLGDVALGAVIKHSRDFNLARESVLGCGLAPETPAFDLQRACGTSLESALLIGHKIASGQIDAGIAAGTDSISDAPVVFTDEYREILFRANAGRSTWQKIRPFFSLRPRHFKPEFPGVVEPRTGLSMGQSCERMAKTWQITRQAQDQLAMESHVKAAQAQKDGFYSDLIPFGPLALDGNVRGDSSLEKLATLRTVFDRSEKGTLTAGNSTPLTDGAAAVLLASEDWAAEHGLEPLAYLSYGEVAAVNFASGEEGLLMAPAYAVPRMLARAGLSLQDFDLYEIHEAFAAQVLCTLRAWEDEGFCRDKLGLKAELGSIDRTKMNLKGGSLAVGHPFAATGARVLGSAAKQLAERGSGRALLSVCTAGGMGVTAIIER